MVNDSSTAVQKKTGLQVFAQICASLTIISRGILCVVCLKTVGGINEAFLNVIDGPNFVKGGGGVPDSNIIFMFMLLLFGVFGLITYIPSILTVIFTFIKKARSGVVVAGAITFGVTIIIDIICAAVIAYFSIPTA